MKRRRTPARHRVKAEQPKKSDIDRPTKRWRVAATMTISVSVEVRAENEEAARERALDASTMTLCNQCADGHSTEWSTSGELDGEIRPEDILEITEIT